MSQHHDPVHPDSDHLTVELIADLEEGLLDATSTAHAQHHLSECLACSDIQAALVEVAHALSVLPPTPMPDHVEQQLLTALRGQSSPPGSDAATVLPLDSAPSRRSSGWAGKGLGVAASVAVLLLVGALAVPLLMDSTTTTASDSAAGGGGPGNDLPSTEALSFAASKTGTSYSADTLDQQVDKLVLAADRATAPADVGSAPVSTPTATSSRPPDAQAVCAQSDGKQAVAACDVALRGALATDPAAAQACLEQYLEVPGVQPLAIDIGTFYDKATDAIKPAAVIVLPGQPDPTRVEVWIVDPECAGTDAVLLYYAEINLR